MYGSCLNDVHSHFGALRFPQAAVAVSFLLQLS